MALVLATAATFSFGVIGATPTLAYTTLCTGNSYSTCTGAGYTDHGYAAHSGNKYWQMDIGHNCTNYVAYVEQTVDGAPAPSYLLGNAADWGTNAANNGVPVSGTPAVGSVAWWNSTDSSANGMGSLGHVSYVENVSGSTGSYTITISEDAAPSGPFDWMTISQGDARWPTNFIHFNDLSTSSGGSRFPGDYFGNGTTTYAVFRPSNGTWYYYYGGAVAQQFGVSGDIPVPGYYSGGPTLDYAVYRPSNETWYVRTQSGSVFAPQPYGLSGDVPVPGDYNGDGKTDYAVYRPSDQTWHYYDGGADVVVSFGLPGDVPVPAYWDGGNMTEPGVFRPSDGTWHHMSGGADVTVQFGVAGDIPVPGYYSGSAKPDYAVFRPSNSTWYVRTQSGSVFTPASFGLPGDVPVPGNYLNNSKTTYAVFRPSNSTWYYYNGGAPSQPFGLSGDIPAISTLPLPLLRQYGLL